MSQEVPLAGDSIQPTPGSKAADLVASLLRRAGAGDLSKVPGLLGVVLRAGQKSDVLGLQPLASEVERVGSGDYPMRVPHESNIPQWKKDPDEPGSSRMGAAAALASALPIAPAIAAGAKGATLVPMNLLRNSDKLASSRLQVAALRAGRMAGQGAPAEEIWNKTQLVRTPGATLGGSRAPTTWTHEVAPGRLADEAMREGFSGKLGDVYHDSELLRQYPALAEAGLVTRDMTGVAQGRYNHTGTVEPGLIELGTNAVSKRGTLEHEINHMVNGTGQQRQAMGYMGSPQDVDHTLEMARILRKQGHTAVADEVEKFGTLPDLSKDWGLSIGENLAEVDKRRSAMTSAERASTLPFDSAKLTRVGRHDTVGLAAERSQLAHPDDPEAAAAFVMQQLRGSKVTPASAMSLYKGGDPSLMLSHAVDRQRLMQTGDLPRELYHLSQGIERNNVGGFTGSNPSGVVLVPHPGQFEPRVSPTAIRARDVYSPRFDQARGARADTVLNSLGEMPESGPAGWEQRLIRGDILTEAAQGRLADRFVQSHKGAGVGAEMTYGASARELPQYGKGAQDLGITRSGFDVPQDSLATALASSPGFTSFKHYEQSPYGARLLDKTQDVPEMSEELFRRLMHRHGGLQEAQVAASGGDVIAQQILRNIKKLPSEYGETKTFGAVGLHLDNFAGIIGRPTPIHLLGSERTGRDALVNKLRQAAKKRGLPFEEAKSAEDAVRIAQQMQGI